MNWNASINYLFTAIGSDLINNIEFVKYIKGTWPVMRYVITGQNFKNHKNKSLSLHLNSYRLFIKNKIILNTICLILTKIIANSNTQ